MPQIKFTQDYREHPAGETICPDKSVADLLIGQGVAELTAAPKKKKRRGIFRK